MIERFRQLARREQIVLGGGAALAVVIIAWSFVWSPLQTAVSDLRESVGERSRLLVDLRRAAGLSSTTVSGAPEDDAQWLFSLVDATARPMGLASAVVNTTPVSGSDSVRVAIENASFTLLVDWLIGLDREHGVRVGDVNLYPASGQPGLVRGQIVLTPS